MTYCPRFAPCASVLRRSSATLSALLATAGALAAVPVPPQLPSPRVVAVLETHVPDLSRFVLRGTVPVLPGVYPRADERVPFTILDYDGTPLLTQAEIVSRYPVDADGADVVELLAVVRRNPALATGAPARYSVLYDEHPEPALPGAWGEIPDAVRELLNDPNGLEIASYDCFGNRYVSRPFGTPQFKQRHHGPIQYEARIYQNMLPETPVPGSTLPHFFGVHAYVSVFRHSWNIAVNLRFTNAHDGHDTTSPADDPLDKLYFRRIELSVPEDWVVMQDFDDPMFGQERRSNGRRIVQLVAPLPNGKLHVMRWLGQFHRRLALAPDLPVTVTPARAMLDGVGRAFCIRGTAPSGNPYWSWWNPATARYFPQRHVLPHLDHVGEAPLEVDLARQLDFLVDHLTAGTGVGDYPLAVGRLGWGHPYGVAYGGMTSGLEINCYDGIETAAAASPTGLRVYSLLHRMQTDRQPNALYQIDGEPASVERWLVENGDRDYVPMEMFVVPQTSGSRPDPFGIRQAPQFQINYVATNGLKPPYEQQHLQFDPHDYQHFIRYTRSAKVLAWLGNDSLAIDDLRMEAENFHLAFHPYYRDQYGAVAWSGLLTMTRYVRAYPHKGCGFGRGEAWGLDCAIAAYSLLDCDWRARKAGWFQEIAELLADAQPCSGFIQAIVSNKAFNGQFQARQLIEQSITENTLIGLRESVFRGAYPAHAWMTRSILVASLRAFISEMAWFPNAPGPFRYTGVGPLDRDLPVWCERSDMAPGSWTAGDFETYQDWSSFAYGLELTDDPVFLRFARIQAGADNFSELVTNLRNAGTNNIENRAALLATVQSILGEL